MTLQVCLPSYLLASLICPSCMRSQACLSCTGDCRMHSDEWTASSGVHDIQQPTQGRWSEDERSSEGPAARAVRNLEQQVAAAAEKATTGSVDMPQDERRREQS